MSAKEGWNPGPGHIDYNPSRPIESFNKEESASSSSKEGASKDICSNVADHNASNIEEFLKNASSSDSEDAGDEGDFNLTREQSRHNIIPQSVRDYCGHVLLYTFIAGFALFFVFSLIPMLRSIKIAGVGVYLWLLILLLIIYTPLWVYNSLSEIIEQIRWTDFSEYGQILESLKVPFTFTLSCVWIGLVWKLLFPTNCLDLASEILINEDLCIFDAAGKILVFLIVSGIFISIDSFLMYRLRSSFQEKSFKDKLIENSYKISILDLLISILRSNNGGSQGQSGDAGSTASQSTDANSMPYRVIFGLPVFILRKCYSYVSMSSEYSQLNSPHSHNEPGCNERCDFETYRRHFKSYLKSSGYKTFSTEPPKNDVEIRKIARKIFDGLSRGINDGIELEDFIKVFPNERAATNAFKIFDLDKDGKVTENEVKGVVKRIFRDQRNLALSIVNSGSVLSVLDRVCFVIASFCLTLFLLYLFGIKVQHILGIVASIAFGLNFIVFDAANKTFHSLVFLFAVHPFDIGDLIIPGKDIGYSEEDIITVLHINIQNTVFRRWNGMQVSIPNHVLAAGPLTNLSRNNEQWEKIEFTIKSTNESQGTLDEETQKLATLRKYIEKFVKYHKADYYPTFELRALIASDNAKAEKSLDLLKFSLKIKCRETFDNQKKWLRHARLFTFIRQATNGAGIQLS